MLHRAKDYVRSTLSTHEKTRRLAELATDALCGATHTVIDTYGEWIPLGWLARDAATVFRREAFDVLQAPYANLQASVHTLEGLIVHLRLQLATIEEELFAARGRAEVLAQQLRDEEDHTSRLERERAAALERGRALQFELEAHRDQVQRTLDDLDRTEAINRNRAQDTELEIRALEAQRDDVRRALEALQNANGLRTPPTSERDIPALEYGDVEEEDDQLPIPGGMPSRGLRSPSANTFGIRTPATGSVPTHPEEPSLYVSAPMDPPPLELRGDDADQFLRALGFTGDSLQAFEDERARDAPPISDHVPAPDLPPTLGPRVSFGSFASLGARAHELDGDATVVDDEDNELSHRRLSVVVVGRQSVLGGEETQSPEKFGSLGESGPPSGDVEDGRFLFDPRDALPRVADNMEQALRALLEMQPGGSPYAADDSSDEFVPGPEDAVEFWLPSFATDAAQDAQEPSHEASSSSTSSSSSRTTDVSLEHDEDVSVGKVEVEVEVAELEPAVPTQQPLARAEPVADVGSAQPNGLDDGVQLTVEADDGADDKLSTLPVPPTPHTIETTTPFPESIEAAPTLVRSRMLDVEGFVVESAPLGTTVRFPGSENGTAHPVHSTERHKSRLAHMIEAGVHALGRSFSGHKHRRTRSESGSANGSTGSETSAATPHGSMGRSTSHRLIKPRSRTSSTREVSEIGVVTLPHGRHSSDSDAHLRQPRMSLAGRFSSLRDVGSKK